MDELEKSLGIKPASEETINSLISIGILYRDENGTIHCVE